MSTREANWTFVRFLGGLIMFGEFWYWFFNMPMFGRELYALVGLSLITLLGVGMFTSIHAAIAIEKDYGWKRLIQSWNWFWGVCKCGHAKSHHNDTMLYKLVCLKNIWRPSKYSDVWELRNARNMVSFCDCQAYRRDWFAFRENDKVELEYQKLREAAEEKELREL